MPDCCWAKFEFVAENEDELYFAVGERIEIVERDEAYGDGWWRGRTQDGKEGLFPMSYITEVEPVKAVPAAAAAASAVPASVTAPTAALATPPSPTSPSIPLQRASSRSPSPTPNGSSGPGGAMGATITDINKAIDHVAADGDSDHENEDSYTPGIGGSTRAKLAEQARLENEQRENERLQSAEGSGHGHRRTSSGFHAHKGIAGNPAGLVYSDESEDEGEEDQEGSRPREESLVPSSGFAALAAAAAGGVAATASHMTGGLFSQKTDDVVSPKTEVIPMPPVDSESTVSATDKRRGSFGQALESPASALAPGAEPEHQDVGLAITTDLPPPPSAPEADIDRAEPPERELEPETVITPVQGSPQVPMTEPPTTAEPETVAREIVPEPEPRTVPAAESEPQTVRAAEPEVQALAAEPLTTEAKPSSAAGESLPELAAPAPGHTTPNFFTIPPRSSIVATPQVDEPAQPASPATVSHEGERSLASSSPAVAPAILAPLAAAPIAVAAARSISPAAAPAPAPAPAHIRTPSLASVSTPLPSGNPHTWSVDQVVNWARSRGFDDAVCAKFQEHEISGDLLLELDANLLKELEIPQFGKRLRIAQAIGELRGERRTRPSSIDRAPSGSASPAPMSTNAGDDEAGWHGSSRKGSVIDSPTIGAPIHEEEELGHERAAPASIISAHSRNSSMPASPLTPGAKRSSSGSVAGHKKNKASVDKPASERMSFFGVNRTRKPPPREDELEKNRSLSRLGFAGGNARPSKGPAPSPPAAAKRLSVTSPDKAETVVDKIGRPDHSGYMKKKGERYNSWKLRYFVLRGPHLYYMKSEQEARIKGHVDLTGRRVVVDENVHSGEYGFRIVSAAGDKEHSFSSPEQSTVREWMKALIKATIARDYSAPVVSSCNIPTIPLIEAQAMSPAPRPPSPTQRDATQRASRRENVNQLTPRDATVLMSLDGGLDSGHKRRVSGLGVPQVAPPRPSRELRRPSGRSIASHYESENPSDILKWVQANVPNVKATTLPGSFTNGLVITRLAEKLSGAKDPVPDSVFAPTSNGAPSVDGLFAMMDTLIDHGFDTASVSPGDVLGGDAEAITRLLESMRKWRGE